MKKNFTKTMMSLLIVVTVIFTDVFWLSSQKAEAATLEGQYYKASSRYGVGTLTVELRENSGGATYFCSIDISTDGGMTRAAYITLSGLYKVKGKKNTWRSKSASMNGKTTKKIIYTLKFDKDKNVKVSIKQKKKVNPFSKYNVNVRGYWFK